MEKKLDGLVTLLAASQPQVQPSVAPDSHPFMTPNSLSPSARTCEFGPIQLQFVSAVPLEEKTQKCSCSDYGTHRRQSSDHAIGIMTPGARYQEFPGESSLPILDLSDEVSDALLENY